MTENKNKDQGEAEKDAYKKRQYFNQLSAVLAMVYTLLLLLPLSVLEKIAERAGILKETFVVISEAIIISLAVLTARKVTNKKFGGK